MQKNAPLYYNYDSAPKIYFPLRYLSNFIILKSYPYLESTLGISWSLLLMSTYGLVCLVVASVWQPETRGLTLTQLSQLFSKREKIKHEEERMEFS